MKGQPPAPWRQGARASGHDGAISNAGSALLLDVRVKFCWMKITQEVRDFTKAQETKAAAVSEAEAEADMAEMSKRFHD